MADLSGSGDLQLPGGAGSADPTVYQKLWDSVRKFRKAAGSVQDAGADVARHHARQVADAAQPHLSAVSDRLNDLGDRVQDHVGAAKDGLKDVGARAKAAREAAKAAWNQAGNSGVPTPGGPAKSPPIIDAEYTDIPPPQGGGVSAPRPGQILLGDGGGEPLKLTGGVATPAGGGSPPVGGSVASEVPPSSGWVAGARNWVKGKWNGAFGGGAEEAAGVGAKTAVVAGAEDALESTVVKTAAVGLVRSTLSVGIGGLIGGGIETVDGIYHHDGGEIAKGALTMPMAAGGGILGAIAAGAATGALVGTVDIPIPFLGTITGAGIGAFVGGMGGTAAGTWAAHKTVDVAVGAVHSVESYFGHKVTNLEDEKTKKMAEWTPLVDTYKAKLAEAAKTGTQKSVDEATTAGIALGKLLNEMGDKKYISQDVLAQKLHEAQDAMHNTVTGINQRARAAAAGIESAVAGQGAAPHAGAAHHAAASQHNSAQGIEAVKALQELIGGVDPDGKLGHQTRQKLLDAGIIKSLDEIPLGASKHAFASDADLKKFFDTHTDNVNAYIRKLQDQAAAKAQTPSAAPDASAAGQGTAPVSPAAAPDAASSAPAPDNTAAAQPQIAIDPQLQAALASLSVFDVERMHPGKGPGGIGAIVGDRKLREIGINVYNGDDGSPAVGGHQYDPKALKDLVQQAAQSDGTRASVNVNILPEGSQRYSVTTADGMDITSAMPPVPSQVIEKAEREHIATISVQEVSDGHSFLFTPQKTPVADKSDTQVAQNH